jgi:carbamoyltransferase
MEFGDRSLGCRSILADPRFINNKDKINKMVKYREEYRPFAPSVLSEEVSKYFKVDAAFKNNYMERVVKVRDKYRKKLQATTHYDGSARVQTVSKELNFDFYKILQEFKKLSGLPILLNTSLNINSEPIVMTPDDAISNFYNSGLDCIVMGDYFLEK